MEFRLVFFVSFSFFFFSHVVLITKILNQRERFLTSLHFNAGSPSLDSTLIREDVLIKFMFSLCISSRIFVISFNARFPGKKFAG